MHALFLQTSAIVSLRFALFFACRKYLLRAIYHDLLHDLPNTSGASGANPLEDVEEPEVELNPLPQPSTSTARLAHDKAEFHSTLSRSLFSLCFEESCVLFALLMCQGIDLLEPRTRAINWNFSLFVILLSILIFIPLSFSLVFTYRRSSSESRPRRKSWAIRALLTVTPVLAYLFLLSYVPLPSTISSTAGISAIISRLIVIGTAILGSLSGFGSVNNAWQFLPLSSISRKIPTDGDISSSEQALFRIRDDLAERRKDLERRESSQSQKDSWLSKVAVSFRGSTELSGIAQELKGLEALERQMSRNLETLRQKRDEAKFSNSIKGRLFGVGGRLFAVYCIFRILSSTINIISPMRSAGDTTSTSSDLVTQLLVYCISLFPSVHMEFNKISSLARQISLVLVGVIILSSVRLVLTGVTRILRITNRKLGASLMLLLLAQLMGIYLLSTLIQLRTSFPSHDRDDNLFSTLPEYVVFGGTFDGSFLAAVVITGLVKWFDEKINSDE